jgi:hypothetical protein
VIHAAPARTATLETSGVFRVDANTCCGADQVGLLKTDRNALVGRQKELEQANIDLVREWQGKLASAREEVSQAFAARDAAKGQLASSQRELVASKKRLDQARDRVSETGSIKAAETSKKAAGKP